MIKWQRRLLHKHLIKQHLDDCERAAGERTHTQSEGQDSATNGAHSDRKPVARDEDLLPSDIAIIHKLVRQFHPKSRQIPERKDDGYYHVELEHVAINMAQPPVEKAPSTSRDEDFKDVYQRFAERMAKGGLLDPMPDPHLLRVYAQAEQGKKHIVERIVMRISQNELNRWQRFVDNYRSAGQSLPNQL